MIATDVHFQTISQISATLQARELSPIELTQACLERIEKVDPSLNAFVLVTADHALAQAKQAEQELAAGRSRGPLHGVPIALKDLYNTKGIRTTGHSKVLLDNVPDADSTCTARLVEAGTVMLGKLAMHEFAFGAPGFDTPFPPARNPWNTEHIPGGSSSGSGAALAAGLCYGALGSDTGGSIRGPAAYCGIVGLKPTYGRVSRAGVLPLSWSLDHAGPMARSVEDCALLLQALAGYDARDPASANVPVADYTAELKNGVQGLRIGLPRSWFDEVDGTNAEVMAAFEASLDVLKSLGATTVELDGTPFMNARGPNMLILIAEAYTYHQETVRTRAGDFSAGVRNRVREGAFVSSADYVDAQRARSVIARQVGALLRDVDLIASPAMATPADRFDDQNPEARYRVPSYSNAFNLTGLPAISVPCGFTAAGLPIGLQLAGRAFDEATVLRAAHAYEEATSWHTMHPPV